MFIYFQYSYWITLQIAYWSRKHLSVKFGRVYRILQEELKENNLDIKEKWELEMNIISDEQWESSCEQGHRVTSSPNWREFGWKIKMRYFRTPLITSKQYLSTMLEGLWQGGRPHTYILGLSKVIRILAKSTKGNKNIIIILSFIYRHTVRPITLYFRDIAW